MHNFSSHKIEVFRVSRIKLFFRTCRPEAQRSRKTTPIQISNNRTTNCTKNIPISKKNARYLLINLPNPYVRGSNLCVFYTLWRKLNQLFSQKKIWTFVSVFSVIPFHIYFSTAFPTAKPRP